MTTYVTINGVVMSIDDAVNYDFKQEEPANRPCVLLHGQRKEERENKHNVKLILVGGWLNLQF